MRRPMLGQRMGNVVNYASVGGRGLPRRGGMRTRFRIEDGKKRFWLIC